MARKFGLEVEFGGNIQQVIVAIREAGLSTATSQHSYMGNSDTEWVVKTDASVARGGELVSPPLDFDDPEQRGQIARAFAALARAGATTSRDAGVHVHIDASDLTPEQIGGVARNFTKYEDAIYRIASSGWQSIRAGASTYAKPLERDKVEKLAKARTAEQIKRAWYGTTDRWGTEGHGHGSRYYGLNLHSWFYRGTVEFRVFNSTMNAKRAEAYVVLCMAIVQDARNGRKRSINKTFKLGEMANGTTAEKKVLHHLCQFLRWENDISPISKEDLDLITYCWKNSRPQRAFASAASW
jgi:hypothetical protein